MAEVNFKNIEIVDRKEELQELQDALTHVAEGNGETIFISGEAGIGKTRIVEELISKAEEAGFRVIRGQCLPETLEPMFPFKSALSRASLDYLLANKPPPLVLSAYLIDSGGLVISKIERKETNLDPDIFVGMLTAIEAFVKDSLKIMGTEENANLNSLSYGDYNILIQSSGRYSLATVIKGEPNEFLIGDMQRILREIEVRLMSWGGEGEVPEEVQEKVEWFITSGKYDGRYLVGEPSIVQENIFDNILMGLQRLSEKYPMLVFIDDLQWADRTSLNFFYYLARNTRKNRIMIIGTYRPEEIIPSGGKLHPLEETLNNLASENLVKILGLPRLEKGDTIILISRILGDFEADVGEKIYKESGGNPLFVIEIIKLLISEKHLSREGKRWKLNVRAERIIIPKKAYELIKRRLERIDDEEREILEVAAVIGDEFDTALLALTSGMDELKILKRLNNIYRKHKLIYEKDGKYHFEHSIIREVLYNELLDELRRKYHKIIGDIILELNKENPVPVANLLAHHYYEARNAKAVPFLLELGDKAKKNYANEEAMEFYSRAQALANREDIEVQVKLFESMGEIHMNLGSYSEALRCFERAESMTENIKIRSRILRKIAEVLTRLGEYEEAMAKLNTALTIINDPVEQGRIYMEMGHIMFLRGEYQKSLDLFRNALKIFASSSEEVKRDIAEVLKGVGSIHLILGDYEKSKKYYTKSLEMMKEIGDMKEVAEILADIGNVYFSTGDLDLANKIYMSSLNIMETVGYKYGIASLLNNLGNVHFRRWALKKALEYYMRSYEIGEKINLRSSMGMVLNNIGNIHLILGNLEDALKSFTESLKISREIGDKYTSSYVLLNIAKVYMEKKNVRYAHSIAKKALEMLRELGDKNGQIEALLTLSEIRIITKKPQEAEKYADEALALAQELKNRDYEMQARRALGAAARQMKQYRRAVIELTKAIRHFQSTENCVELARTQYEMGMLWKMRDDKEHARENYENAMRIFSEHGMKTWAEKCAKELDLL